MAELECYSVTALVLPPPGKGSPSGAKKLRILMLAPLFASFLLYFIASWILLIIESHQTAIS